ncbi:MAG: sugar phosphate nucleotidyltransferase [Acidobacteriaceae bacterium]
MNVYCSTNATGESPLASLAGFFGSGPFFPEAEKLSARSRCNCASHWPPRLALLAGGLATRLRPLTTSTPKSLIQIAGEPFLAHQLRLLRAGGIREVVICCGFLGEQIEEFAGDGSGFGLSIAYSYDGETPLGTGGALRAALPLLGRQFLVMYGDSWLTEPIEPIWRAFCESGKPALMTVYRNQNRWGSSNVEYRKGVVVRYDKRHPSTTMHHIDYGFQVLDAGVLERWTVPVFDLSDVLSGLADYSMLAGHESADRFYEIGSFSGLREAEPVVAAGADPAVRALSCPRCGRPPEKDAPRVC